MKKTKIKIKNIKIGKISKPYGILGWANLYSYTKKKNKIFNYKPWFIKKKKIYKYIKIKKWIIKKKKIIIKINNINIREKINNIKQKKIIIHTYNLKKLKNNEYYFKDILKCHVFTTKKNYIGIIKKILTNKQQNTLIIKKNKLINKKEILIPFIINKIIKNINLIKKKIIIKYNHK